MEKFEAIKNQFREVVLRLNEVLAQEKNTFIRDSAIKRFEFTFDLSWKLIKAYLEEIHGIICASPKKCFREAYKQGLVEYDTIWLEMTDERNQISHMYKEELAEELYKKLPNFLTYFQELLQKI
jgi:nucleotidyltransferase substrate binding protein (TIGR01987 family)